MNIVKLSATNFKRLKAVVIEPDGTLVRLHGRNAQGKSSALDAIEAVLGGKAHCPDDPVRHGEETAEIELIIGDKYKITRIFDGKSGRSQLKVTSVNGKIKFSAEQSLLNSLIGEGLGFDPLKFMRDKPKEQAELLQALAGVDFTELDGRRAKLYEDRRIEGRLRTDTKGSLAEMPVPEPNLPSKPHDLGEIDRGLAEIQQVGRRRYQLTTDIEAERNAIEQTREELLALELRIRRYEELINQKEARVNALVSELSGMPDDEMERRKLEAKAEGLRRENVALTDATRFRDAEEIYARHDTKYNDLTRQITELDDTRKEIQSKAKYPIDGLEIINGVVHFNNLALNQASSSEQIRVSTAIGIALEPTIKLMMIREGSLLDQESLAEMVAMAKKTGHQIWIECVADEHDGVGWYIEDGEAFGPEDEAFASAHHALTGE